MTVVNLSIWLDPCGLLLNDPILHSVTTFGCEECGEPSSPLYQINVTASGKCGVTFVCNPRVIHHWFGVFGVQTADVALMNVFGEIGQGGTPTMPNCVDDDLSSGFGACACEISIECGGQSPIILSMRDNRIELVPLSDGVAFDLNGNGVASWTSWTAIDSDDAFLVLDRNRNGIIDNGKELFGDGSAQPMSEEPNGFLALSVFDDSLSGGNENGRMDPDDRIFSELQLWFDANKDGTTDGGELRYLEEAGVEWISLDYRETRRTDRHGNQFRYAAPARVNGQQRTAWDVFFVTGPIE